MLNSLTNIPLLSNVGNFFISVQTGKEDKFMLQYTMNNNKELSQRIIIFVHR